MPLIAGIAMMFPLWLAGAQSPDMSSGRRQAQLCMGCHAIAAADGLAPSLGGQPAGDIRRALIDFRSGRRRGTSMPAIARGLSDGDIANLSAFFAAQRTRRPSGSH